jgi:hypothetical protein
MDEGTPYCVRLARQVRVWHYWCVVSAATLLVLRRRSNHLTSCDIPHYG